MVRCHNRGKPGLRAQCCRPAYGASGEALRCQPGETAAGKTGGAIAVGAGTCGGQTITIMAIYNWMLSRGIICVPGELNGVTAVANEPGDILKQPKRLRQAEILGENVLNVAQKLRGT